MKLFALFTACLFAGSSIHAQSLTQAQKQNAVEIQLYFSMMQLQQSTWIPAKLSENVLGMAKAQFPNTDIDKVQYLKNFDERFFILHAINEAKVMPAVLFTLIPGDDEIIQVLGRFEGVPGKFVLATPEIEGMGKLSFLTYHVEIGVDDSKDEYESKIASIFVAHSILADVAQKAGLSAVKMPEKMASPADPSPGNATAAPANSATGKGINEWMAEAGNAEALVALSFPELEKVSKQAVTSGEKLDTRRYYGLLSKAAELGSVSGQRAVLRILGDDAATNLPPDVYQAYVKNVTLDGDVIVLKMAEKFEDPEKTFGKSKADLSRESKRSFYKREIEKRFAIYCDANFTGDREAFTGVFTGKVTEKNGEISFTVISNDFVQEHRALFEGFINDVKVPAFGAADKEGGEKPKGFSSIFTSALNIDLRYPPAAVHTHDGVERLALRLGGAIESENFKIERAFEGGSGDLIAVFKNPASGGVIGFRQHVRNRNLDLEGEKFDQFDPNGQRLDIFTVVMIHPNSEWSDADKLASVLNEKPEVVERFEGAQERVMLIASQRLRPGFEKEIKQKIAGFFESGGEQAALDREWRTKYNFGLEMINFPKREMAASTLLHFVVEGQFSGRLTLSEQAKIASMFLFRENIWKSNDEAFLRPLIDQGSGEAAYRLMRLESTLPTPDQPTVTERFKVANGLNYPQAAYLVGLAHFNNGKVELGIRNMRLASEAGHSGAEESLGIRLLMTSGDGNLQSEGIEFLRRAALKQNSLAKTLMVTAAKMGMVPNPEVSEIEKWGAHLRSANFSSLRDDIKEMKLELSPLGNQILGVLDLVGSIQ